MKARVKRLLFLAFGSSLPLALVAFATAPAQAAPPLIGGAFIAGTTTNSTVLHGTIDSGGRATTYHFEYGSGDCASSPCAGVPVPDAKVAGLVAGKGDVAAGSFEVTDLTATSGSFGPGQTIVGKKRHGARPRGAGK
jgi:hypothetical protein